MCLFEDTRNVNTELLLYPHIDKKKVLHSLFEFIIEHCMSTLRRMHCQFPKADNREKPYIL